MSRSLAPIVALLMLGLAACETTGNNVSGTADYDSLSRATATCKAEGGKLVLKPDGDPQRLQAYECKVN
ncbi:MAG TPA: hypothetical protein VFE18_05590 [Phenylobacterium sp.]|jgi:hypothetical protein|uniref:hypothetical protein n=1 Tax=Phenylobacterium sp. TaxID=1871053 RepID=UPI002D449446|nr:hypothetical protein [Phenylobacterium sp.]HZZ67626.1 hypothetical protein [Phenylobacterium sp.]